MRRLVRRRDNRADAELECWMARWVSDTFDVQSAVAAEHGWSTADLPFRIRDAPRSRGACNQKISKFINCASGLGSKSVRARF